MAKLTLLLFGLLAVSQANANNVLGVQENLSKLLEKLNKESLLIGDAQTINFIKDAIDAMKSKINSVERLYDEAIEDVNRLPQECREDTVQNLKEYKAKSVSDFFHCPKLLPGLVNIFYIFDVTVELTFDMVITMMSTVRHLFGCMSDFWPWKVVPCWFRTIESNIGQIISSSNEYRHLVKGYAKNLTAAVESCWQNSSAVVDIVSSVSDAYHCAGKDVPYELYKLP